MEKNDQITISFIRDIVSKNWKLHIGKIITKTMNQFVNYDDKTKRLNIEKRQHWKPTTDQMGIPIPENWFQNTMDKLYRMGIRPSKVVKDQCDPKPDSGPTEEPEFKIPDSINIAGRTITIEWHNSELLKRNNDGEADYRGQKIYISNGSGVYDQCQEDINVVFIHEVVHFINHITSCGMNEADVERFSEILYQVIKQLIKGGKHG